MIPGSDEGDALDDVPLQYWPAAQAVITPRISMSVSFIVLIFTFELTVYIGNLLHRPHTFFEVYLHERFMLLRRAYELIEALEGPDASDGDSDSDLGPTTVREDIDPHTLSSLNLQ